MIEPHISVHQAIRDLREIKRAIARAEGSSDDSAEECVTSTHLASHVIAVTLASAFAAAELISYHNATNFLYASYHDERWRYVGIAAIAAILVSLIVALYLSIWREAQREGEAFNDYIARNFLYLRNVSFLSDLFVKFSAVALVILARRPDWVAPLLFLFTGDYLLQGRFFVLPVNLSLVAGFLFVIAAVVQLIFYEGVILYPMAAFAAVGVWSLLRIRRLRNKAQERTA